MIMSTNTGFEWHTEAQAQGHESWLDVAMTYVMESELEKGGVGVRQVRIKTYPKSVGR